MRFLISNNFKMDTTTAHDLVDKVLKYKDIVDGFEMCPDYDNPSELKFMHELAFECNEHNLYFQIHGNSSVNVDRQVEFIKELDSIGNLLGYNINLVLHPQTLDNLDDAKKATDLYFNELLNKTKDYKVVINIENLNSIKDLRRLSMPEIEPILMNNPDLKLTYDMGHVLVDDKDIFNIDKSLIDRIVNVHFHSYDYFSEHHVIEENDMHKDEIVKCIAFLKHIKYNGSIVFEYDFNRMDYDDYDTKLEEYVKSIGLIKQYF